MEHGTRARCNSVFYVPPWVSLGGEGESANGMFHVRCSTLSLLRRDSSLILTVTIHDMTPTPTPPPTLGECTSDPLTSKVITSSTHNLKVTHTFYIGFSPTTRATAASMPTLVFEETMRPLAHPGPVHALEMPIMLRLVRIDNRKLQC